MTQNEMNLIKDIVFELIILAKDASASSASDDAFQSGRALGLYESLSLIIQQLESFGVNLDEVGINKKDFDSGVLR